MWTQCYLHLIQLSNTEIGLQTELRNVLYLCHTGKEEEKPCFIFQKITEQVIKGPSEGLNLLEGTFILKSSIVADLEIVCHMVN